MVRFLIDPTSYDALAASTTIHGNCEVVLRKRFVWEVVLAAEVDIFLLHILRDAARRVCNVTGSYRKRVVAAVGYGELAIRAVGEAGQG